LDEDERDEVAAFVLVELTTCSLRLCDDLLLLLVVIVVELDLGRGDDD